jgi:transcriptional regulator with XRE-family HTH domain
MPSEKAVIFGQRLRELRERAGLTQGQLAERAGMHRQGIAKLELGEREPLWSTVQALAEALGVSFEQLAEKRESPPPPARRGRPPKAKPEAEAPKRPRGRPRKAEAEKPPAKKKPRGKKK